MTTHDVRRCPTCRHIHRVGPTGRLYCGGDDGTCACDPSEPDRAPVVHLFLVHRGSLYRVPCVDGRLVLVVRGVTVVDVSEAVGFLMAKAWPEHYAIGDDAACLPRPPLKEWAS